MENKIPLRLATIEQAISKASRVSIEDIRGSKRDKEMAEARQAIWYVGHDYLGYSYAELGRYYQKDHTTIIHGVAKIRKAQKDVGESLIAGIKKTCPEVLDRPSPGEPRTVRDYEF